MATCDIQTLISSACASGFKCLSEEQYRATVLQLLCNISVGGADFVRDNISLFTQNPLNVAHGLGATPSRVRVVAKVIAAFDNYSVGDEIAIEGVYDSSDYVLRISYGANATNVWICQQQGLDSWPGALVITKTSGGTISVTTSEIIGKLYAWK